MMQKTWKMTETLAHGYPFEGTQQDYPKNTNMTAFWKIFASLCIWENFSQMHKDAKIFQK